jgi:hypothetical protein
MDPEAQVREVLLKDKFLTQSAPDTYKKLSLWLKKKVIGSTNTTSHVCTL